LSRKKRARGGIGTGRPIPFFEIDAGIWTSTKDPESGVRSRKRNWQTSPTRRPQNIKREKMRDSLVEKRPREPWRRLNSAGVRIFIIEGPPFRKVGDTLASGIGSKMGKRGSPKNSATRRALDMHSATGHWTTKERVKCTTKGAGAIDMNGIPHVTLLLISVVIRVR